MNGTSNTVSVPFSDLIKESYNYMFEYSDYLDECCGDDDNNSKSKNKKDENDNENKNENETKNTEVFGVSCVNNDNRDLEDEIEMGGE
jgi:hypothetical protein